MPTASSQYCYRILPKVSRTFALSIQILTGHLHDSILVGYLLCRVADSIEDDPKLAPKVKSRLLRRFGELFKPTSQKAYQKELALVQGSKWEVDLIANLDHVRTVLLTLPPRHQKAIVRTATKMAAGMASFVERYPQGFRIQSMSEFKNYCYYVAGVVGELLTQIWGEYLPDSGRKGPMMKLAVTFGEALQATNILKDIHWDFQTERSIYLPQEYLKAAGSDQSTLFDPRFDRQNLEAYRRLLQNAEANLDSSVEYIRRLPRWNPRIRLFCILPLLLAIATLQKLKSVDQFENLARGVKLSRTEVRRLWRTSLLGAFSNWGLAYGIRTSGN